MTKGKNIIPGLENGVYDDPFAAFRDLVDFGKSKKRKYRESGKG